MLQIRNAVSVSGDDTVYSETIRNGEMYNDTEYQRTIRNIGDVVLEMDRISWTERITNEVLRLKISNLHFACLGGLDESCAKTKVPVVPVYKTRVRKFDSKRLLLNKVSRTTRRVQIY